MRITPRSLDILARGPPVCGDLALSLSQAGPQFTQVTGKWILILYISVCVCNFWKIFVITLGVARCLCCQSSSFFYCFICVEGWILAISRLSKMSSNLSVVPPVSTAGTCMYQVSRFFFFFRMCYTYLCIYSTLASLLSSFSLIALIVYYLHLNAVTVYMGLLKISYVIFHESLADRKYSY